jgi:2-methylcitrate dehydratase PrpD
MTDVLRGLSRFAAEAAFGDLPEPIVHEAKRVLLDSIGCALASISSEKGRLCIALSQRLGGPPEASVIGVSGKVSCSNAVLANGELINAMDYDALVIPGGHVSPYVVPPALAIAEERNATGKDLILATVLSHEVAMRITRGMSPMIQVFAEGPGAQRYEWTTPYGGSRFNVGAAAGVGRLLGLDTERMVHALGLAGHHTQVPTHAKLSYSVPTSMVKYGTPGWQGTGAIVACYLAEMGYLGDETLFDGASGLWRFTGSDTWMPDRVLAGIQEEWLFAEQQYKPYPCCRVLHASLDMFYRMVEQYRFKPEDIQSINVFGPQYCEKPHLQNRVIRSAIDAQFSAAYNFAVAAHGVTIGPEWQDEDTMRDAKILAFMDKVTCSVHPDYVRRPLQDRLMSLGRIEVTANGRTYTDETTFAYGTPRPGFEMDDAALVGKFRHNAQRVLTPAQIDAAVDALMDLTNVRAISDLMQHIVPAHGSDAT